MGGGNVAPCITAHYHKAGGRDFYPDNPQVPHLAILEIEEVEMEEANAFERYEFRLMPNGNIRAYNPTSKNYEKGVNGYHIINPNNIADTVISTHVPNVLEEIRPIQVAQIYDPKENPMNGRVYSQDGIAPTLRTPTGGLSEPKIAVSCAIRGRNPENPSDKTDGINTEQRIELGGDVANCLTSVQKDSMVIELAILTPKRSEKAKELRRQGIEVFANRELVPREDGCSNTVTTVQKDNLLQEPCIIGYSRDHKGNVQSYHEKNCANTIHTHTGSGGNTDQFVKEMVIGSMQANAMHGSLDGVSPCLTEAMGTGGGQIPMVTIRYRIRKLTERECLRLMGMDDADIDKIDAYRIKTTLKDGTVKEKPIPKSQKYKMAGNSIVVDVLYNIFYQMFIAEQPKPQPKQLTLFD